MTYTENASQARPEAHSAIDAPAAPTKRARKSKTPAKPKPTLAQRHAAMTDKSGGLFACWFWTGAVRTDGYGQFARIKDGEEIQSGAHIAAWEIANDCELPEGKLIRHTCNCPLCQNPSHMLLGTPLDNTADMIKAGRQAKGRTPAATVRQIAKMGIDGMKAPAIAAKVGVSVTVVRSILRGETYTKITGIPRNRASSKGRDLIAIMGVADIVTPRPERKPVHASIEAVA